LSDVDRNTFNEYKYRITEQFLELRNRYEINGTIDVTAANRILTLANE
jgi:hypothetical protein